MLHTRRDLSFPPTPSLNSSPPPPYVSLSLFLSSSSFRPLSCNSLHHHPQKFIVLRRRRCHQHQPPHLSRPPNTANKPVIRMYETCRTPMLFFADASWTCILLLLLLPPPAPRLFARCFMSNFHSAHTPLNASPEIRDTKGDPRVRPVYFPRASSSSRPSRTRPPPARSPRTCSPPLPRPLAPSAASEPSSPHSPDR